MFDIFDLEENVVERLDIMIHGRKPIMSPELEAQVMNAVQMYSKKDKWRQWGLHNLREQGAAFLLEGPPGCGKTVIANYIARKVRRKGIVEISFKDFGSATPGENGRQIEQLFKHASDNGGMTVYLDECDTILVDRNKLGPDAQWMLEVINELLTQISKYKYLVILSTNRPETLDPALARRLLAKVKVPRPDYPERMALWKQKIPSEYPVQPTQAQLEKLATLQLTGSDVETIIINASSDALRLDRKPSFLDLLTEARNQANQ